LEQKEITGRVIGAALEVHRELGPGFLESIYEYALASELRARKISFRRQVAIPVLYRGFEVGLHRLDFLVSDRIVVELKAVREFENIHFVVVRSYLRATSCEHGLLVNFANLTLEVKRVTSGRIRTS
jgi:GxxExxY protein